MCTVTITSPMNLGGKIYQIGTHEIDLKRDWFVDEMERVGMLTITDGEALRVSTEVIVDATVVPQEDLTVDREALKAEATALGLEFAPNVKNEKLAQMIADKKAETVVPQEAE